MDNERSDVPEQAVIEAIEEAVPGLRRSRSVAVDRVLGGGLAAGVGLSASFAALFMHGDAIALPVFLGGILISGVGLGTLGMAATHLARYGKRRPALILGAFTGLGASVALYGIWASYTLFAAGNFIQLAGLDFVFLIAGLGFATFIALLTMGALLRWMLTSSESASGGGPEPRGTSPTEQPVVGRNNDSPSAGSPGTFCLAV